MTSSKKIYLWSCEVKNKNNIEILNNKYEIMGKWDNNNSITIKIPCDIIDFMNKYNAGWLVFDNVKDLLNWLDNIDWENL